MNDAELIQYINLHEQKRADLEYKVRKISRYIIDNFERVLGNNHAAKLIVCAIKELLDRLEYSADFVENELSTHLGRLFVQKVLFVVARIQEYVSDLVASDLDSQTREQITWTASKYCEVLTRYATRIQTI